MPQVQVPFFRRSLAPRPESSRFYFFDEPKYFPMVSLVDAEHPSPGVTQDVVVLQPQCLSDLLDFLAEPVYLPEAFIIRLVRIEGTELVVVNDLNAFLREVICEALEVLMTRAWTTVKSGRFDLAHPQN